MRDISGTLFVLACGLCKMKLFPGAQLLALLMVFCKLISLAEGKAVIRILIEIKF